MTTSYEKRKTKSPSILFPSSERRCLMANPKKVDNIIKIGDAILTEKALKFVTGMQFNNNEAVSMWRDIVTDAAFKIINLSNDHGVEMTKEDNMLIADLSNIRDSFLELQKP